MGHRPKGLAGKGILLPTLLFVTFFTTDTVLFGTNGNSLFSKAVQLCVAAFSGFLLIYAVGRKKQIRRQHLFLLLLLFSCIAATMAARREIGNGYIYKFALLLFAFFAAELIDIKTFARCFDQVMFVLAMISLICFALELIDHKIFSFAPRVYNSVGYGFQNLFFYIQSDAGFSPRNYGIYREPGVYQMFLIVALLFESYFFEKLRLAKIVVFSITLFTTLSTTGIIAYAVWVLLILAKRGTFTRKRKLWIVFGGLLLGLIAAAVFHAQIGRLIQEVFGKMVSKNASYMAREASVTLNIRLWLTSPVFGVGIYDIEPAFKEMAFQVYGQRIDCNTNLLLLQFAVHGTLYGALWTAGLVKGACHLGGSRLERWLIAAVIGILCLGEALTFSPFGNLLMMYGLLSSQGAAARDREVLHGKEDTVDQLGELREYRYDRLRYTGGGRGGGAYGLRRVSREGA